MLESVPAFVYAVLYAIGVVFGLRGAVRTTRRWWGSRPRLNKVEQLIVALLAFVCWVIVAAGLYWGILALRILAGFDPLGLIAAVGSAILATTILYIPTVIDLVLEYVANHRGDPDA